MACKEKCFTFTWKLKNISYYSQEKDASIFSPSFVVDWIKETKFYLGLYMTDGEYENDISIYLYKEGPKSIEMELEFELGFVLVDGSVVTPGERLKYNFSQSEGFGYLSVLKREDVFISKRSAFLPKDTLTAWCGIWKNDGEMAEDIWCLARTRIEVLKRSFLWNVKNFSSLELEKKYSYQMKSIENNAPFLSVDLSLSGGLNSEQTICFELSLQNQTMMFLSLRLSLLDASRNRVLCNQEEFWFGDPSKPKVFKFFFTKKELMAMKSSYLPDDILSLHWEWAFSDGVVSGKIDNVHYACASSESKYSNAENANSQNTIPISDALSNNLKSFYDENFLCDVKLKTSTKEFPAHKIILSASSSVFKAMFSHDMKEKGSDCVNISGLSDDAVSGMLHYIYATRLDDLTWEKASYLYVAADKYAILSLKNICSSYIKDNLSPSNACEALLLFDFHSDSDFKSAVQDYILKHGKQIINSEEWKNLIQTNSKIAAETLCLLFK